MLTAWVILTSFTGVDMRVFIIIVCFLFLNACVSPVTKDDLRKQSHLKLNFEINQPYQTVFSTLLAQTRACYLDKPTVRQITVVGDRDNATKTANITVEEVYAMAEHDAYLVIDIRSTEKNFTHVSAYLSSSNANSQTQEEIKSIKSWVLENNKQCHVHWLS